MFWHVLARSGRYCHYLRALVVSNSPSLASVTIVPPLYQLYLQENQILDEGHVIGQTRCHLLDAHPNLVTNET
jgi:hypothetical protein